MTITALLAPIPKWIIIDNNGTVAGGAKLYTYSSKNKEQLKPVFMDPAMAEAWPNPILFDLNGVQGPFYWTVNSADLTDTYFLVVQNAQGVELWTVDNFFPPGSGGGGTSITNVPVTNYIANNQFIDHIDTTTTTAQTNIVVAPSNHKGFTPALVNPIVGTYGVVGPDIRFLKDSVANTDSISFPLFALNDSPLTGDVTPVDYVRFQCTTNNPGEQLKCFQFPITQKIKNLSNQPMTFKIWAAVTAVTKDIKLYVRQYFGSGTAASADFRQDVGTMTLTSTWTQQSINFVVPDVAGKSIGNVGFQTDDDALYLQLEMPHNDQCDILFTKPKLYLGTINQSIEFDDYDQINSVNSTPRTGDVKTSLTTVAPNGWVAMNDGTIGEEGSGASNRANKDTFQLYKTIWDGVIDTWAPVSTGRGATAQADFIAGKTLKLPRTLGRALAGFGGGAGLTSRALGEFQGAETVTLAKANMPTSVPVNLGGTGVVNFGLPGGNGYNFPALASVGVGTNPYTGGDGGTTSIVQPTSFMNVFIKL
jgi:hypothetical protein